VDVLTEVLIRLTPLLAVVLIPAAYYAWRRRRSYYVPWALAYWLAIGGIIWGFSMRYGFGVTPATPNSSCHVHTYMRRG
jgi:uncharacterized membrane protein YedE/YeeE